MSPRLQSILALPKVTHNLMQGTDAWHQFRLQHRGASEAAAAVGLSRKMKRSELLHMKHTGLAREFSDWLQRNVLDKGHELEALARPLLEEAIGEKLYPMTCSRGHLSASCDGLTMDDSIAFEHKQWSEELAAAVRAGQLPEEHAPQCQQILLVTGADELHFVVSDGTPDRWVRLIVLPNHGWWERIVASWDQFDADLAAYTPPAAEAPKPIGHAPETLPALRIEITGAVTASNLAEFRETALGAIRSVNRELTTDSHFADAEQAVKWCGEVESRIKAAKEHALSQTASIEALFRTLDDVSAEARRVRLDLEKLVERRKVEIKSEMVAAAKAAYERHEAALRQECGAWRLLSPPDFAGAIKGKRNVAAMQDALDTALANAKIKADEQARTIRAALAALGEESKGFEHLFRDRMDFMMLPTDIVRQMVRGRIAEHKAAEERRLEAERARIRAEEEARAAAAQREKNAMALQEIQGIQQQVMIATLGRAGVRKGGTIECIRETLAETEGWRIEEANFGALTDAAQAAKEKAVAEIRQLLADAEARAQQLQTAAAEEQRRQEVALAEQERRSEEALRQALPAAGPAVIPLPTRAPAAPTAQPTLRLGEIQKRLAPLSIDAAGLATLGFPVVKQEGAAKLWRESDWHGICAAIAQHVVAVANGQRLTA